MQGGRRKRGRVDQDDQLVSTFVQFVLRRGAFHLLPQQKDHQTMILIFSAYLHMQNIKTPTQKSMIIKVDKQTRLIHPLPPHSTPSDNESYLLL